MEVELEVDGRLSRARPWVKAKVQAGAGCDPPTLSSDVPAFKNTAIHATFQLAVQVNQSPLIPRSVRPPTSSAPRRFATRVRCQVRAVGVILAQATSPVGRRGRKGLRLRYPACATWLRYPAPTP